MSGTWGILDDHEAFWTFCAASATSIAAFAAALSAYYSKKITDQTEVSSKLDRVLSLQDKFTSDYIKNRRNVAAAVALVALQQPDPLQNDLSEMEEVLDFFTTVGFLANRGAVSYEMAWHEFHYWIYGYVSICHSHMKRVQEADPQRWVELDKLFDELLTIECFRSNKSLPRYDSVDALKTFFEFELTATNDSTHR